MLERAEVGAERAGYSQLLPALRERYPGRIGVIVSRGANEVVTDGMTVGSGVIAQFALDHGFPRSALYDWPRDHLTPAEAMRPGVVETPFEIWKSRDVAEEALHDMGTQTYGVHDRQLG